MFMKVEWSSEGKRSRQGVVGNVSGDGKTVAGLKEVGGRIIYHSRKTVKVIFMVQRAEN